MVWVVSIYIQLPAGDILEYGFSASTASTPFISWLVGRWQT